MCMMKCLRYGSCERFVEGAKTKWHMGTGDKVLYRPSGNRIFAGDTSWRMGINGYYIIEHHNVEYAILDYIVNKQDTKTSLCLLTRYIQEKLNNKYIDDTFVRNRLMSMVKHKLIHYRAGGKHYLDGYVLNITAYGRFMRQRKMNKTFSPLGILFRNLASVGEYEAVMYSRAA